MKIPLKTSTRRACLIPPVLLAVLVPLLAATPASAAAPEQPQELAPSPLLATSAALHGVLNPGKSVGPFEIDTYEFVYRQSAGECKGAGEITTPASMSAGGGKEEVSAEIVGLTAGTKYTTCLIVHNEAGTESATSTPVSLETAEAVPPAIEAQMTEGETKNAVTAEAVINPGGAETTCEVRYGKTEALEATPVPCPEAIPAGTTSGFIAPELTGLEPNTEYHFKFVATNIKGTTEAPTEATFKTHPAVGVTTQPATSVKRAHAILHGEVNPEGVPTTYYYEYGPCDLTLEACGMRTPIRGPVNNQFPEPIATEPFTVYRLKPGTTYHYRLVAVSAGATFPAPQETFTTASAEPKEYVFNKKLEGHELPSPAGAAVNQATGDVYVTDSSAGTLERFNAAGIWQASVAMPASGEIYGVAVDNSCFYQKLSEPTCKSTDPSSEDVYVASVRGGFVYKFDRTSAGELALDPTTPEIGQGELPLMPGTGGGPPSPPEPKGVAVDAAGNVYITSNAGTVSKFSATGEDLNSELVKSPPTQEKALAIDAAGNIYLAGEKGTAEYTSAGACVNSCTAIDSNDGAGVAVDAAGDVFISQISGGGAILEYAPTEGHARIANPELEGAGLIQLLPRGLAVNTTSKVIYAGDVEERAEMFSYVAAKPVTVKTEPATQVGGTIEQLNGLVDPNGTEAAEYDFEYGTSSCDTGTETCGTLVTEPDQMPLYGPAAIPVSVRLEHLAPDTTYHYWVVAANEESGAEHGEEQTFTTGSLEALPPPPAGDQAEHGTPAGEEPAPAVVFPDLTSLVPTPGPKGAVPHTLTRLQRLQRALRACRKAHSRKARSLCQKKARRSYGSPTKK
jgi:DNA-binding beta-propeller fold protein YncE